MATAVPSFILQSSLCLLTYNIQQMLNVASVTNVDKKLDLPLSLVEYLRDVISFY